jgi:predicted TIM-barrel fold metal-dependent hydrolase
MNPRKIVVILAILAVGAVAVIGARHLRNRAQNRPYTLTGQRLADYTSLEPIDAHTHVFQTSRELTEMLERLHMHALDILYVDDTDPYLKDLKLQRAAAFDFVKASAGHAELCTTFDPFELEKQKFSTTAVAGLNEDFERGAVAVKLWKNVGMELVSKSGKYVVPDDPAFQAIIDDVAAHNKTLIVHAADPDEAWLLVQPGSSPTYYTNHPQWDMTKKTDAPAKNTILQARDHLIANHPGLRVVGAHLGSLETHIDELAARLDRYPNFAVDTAARVRQFVVQPREKVRVFVLKYQDRILYGTDLHLYAGATDSSAMAQAWERQYARDYRYFSTADKFVYQGHEVQGLNLPRPVLKKLYHDNAVRWIPGIFAQEMPKP